ncbi:putative RNA-directed DNA polymerase [Rosa chinensis]|uniref:Putative RNA-directed DNA polymerase n=1 Tax=Rosa chinensis TaxID=74649 RepID=A0A2P6RW94_ROSCH|nr:putative RNA-directed DNA polymerase [Rosa chinensis]
MTRFRQALVDCGLMDMGFVGSRFTWANRFTKVRLDRACQNFQWRELYPFSRVITLPLSRSDHCPLLIEVNPERPPARRSSRRFRFEEMWLNHSECSQVIKTGWLLPSTGESMTQVGRKIKQTGSLLLSWNEGVFQQRQVEMRLIQRKLDTVMAVDHQNSHFDEIKALQFRLNELLSINETYWRQRSKVQWLREGDRNTSFFHRRASNRRSRNRIKGLLTENGQWTSEPGEVTNILLQYYEASFRSEQSDPIAMNLILDCIQPRVTESMNGELMAPYSDDEIKRALFQMHPSKSPGPDGMSPCFFQKFWDVVEFDVCQAVREVLNQGDKACIGFTPYCSM